MSIAINKQKCVGCGRCQNVCPGSLIKIDESGKAYIKYQRIAGAVPLALRNVPYTQ